jgi:hypothetical protein
MFIDHWPASTSKDNMWPVGTTIFSSDVVWNFIFDDDTNEFLEILTNDDDCNSIQDSCILEVETPLKDLAFFQNATSLLTFYPTLIQKFKWRVHFFALNWLLNARTYWTWLSNVHNFLFFEVKWAVKSFQIP